MQVGEVAIIEELFNEMDDDAESSANLDEFLNWMNGVSGRRRIARSLKLADRAEDDDVEWCSIHSVKWTVETFRQVGRAAAAHCMSCYPLLTLASAHVAVAHVAVAHAAVAHACCMREQ